MNVPNKLVSYFEHVVRDAYETEDRSLSSHPVKYEMVVIRDTLIIRFQSHYQRIGKRIVYRMLHNFRKYIDVDELLIVSNMKYVEGETEYNCLCIYPNMIPPHHTIARCDFGGKFGTICDVVNHAYPVNEEESPMCHLKRLSDAGFDYTRDGISNCASEEWDRYASAMLECYGVTLTDITDQIMKGTVQ